MDIDNPSEHEASPLEVALANVLEVMPDVAPLGLLETIKSNEPP